MVQGEQGSEATRLKLISLLPRLRRFAAMLVGDRAGSDRLLRDSCLRMLSGERTNSGGKPFDRWAFGELHELWLERLRDNEDPWAQGRGDERLFKAAFAGAEADAAETAETASILTQLPPQHRSAAVLIYGDGFSYDDAADILDVPTQTVFERATRALSALTERSGVAGAQGAQIQSLFPGEQQAG